MIFVYRTTSVTLTLVYCPSELDSIASEIHEFFLWQRESAHLTPWHLLFWTERPERVGEELNRPAFNVGNWITPEHFFRTEFKHRKNGKYHLQGDQPKTATPLNRVWERVPPRLLEYLLTVWRSNPVPSLYLPLVEVEAAERWPDGFGEPPVVDSRYDRNELL